MTATLVTFYADDFTGASDNLAQFHRHGLKSVLFFDTPSQARLDALQARGGADVVGVAGIARALPTASMAAEIDPAIAALETLGAPLLQYKCCSTFDSSPAIGSLGEAARRLLHARPGAALAVLAAMPEFGRYTVFGNHFARFGDAVHRLDRHPVMSRHPSTPMHEADLTRVLAEQGLAIASAIDVNVIDASDTADALRATTDWSRGPVVFDSCTNEQLIKAAGAIWLNARSSGKTAVALAAQGLAHGLGQYLTRTGEVSRAPPPHTLAPVERLLVLSGSCSPLNAVQIGHARDAGWSIEALDPTTLLDPRALDAREIGARLGAAMQRTGGAVVHTALGPDDPAIARVREFTAAHAIAPQRLAEAIGCGYAAIIRDALEHCGVRRVVVAGGDSSSYTMRALGAWALEVAASSFADAAHVCRLLSDDPLVDGVEVLLKGGQAGRPDVLLRMRSGF